MSDRVDYDRSGEVSETSASTVPGVSVKVEMTAEAEARMLSTPQMLRLRPKDREQILAFALQMKRGNFDGFRATVTDETGATHGPWTLREARAEQHEAFRTMAEIAWADARSEGEYHESVSRYNLASLAVDHLTGLAS